MDRREKLLGDMVYAASLGIEIGALHSPTVSRADGRVIYVDYAPAALLREKLQHPGVDPADILEVDIVWAGAGSLAEALGEQADYAVASHVIEHVPDLIGWLRQIHGALKAGGVLGLAIPDRRFTFDAYRNDSGIAEVLEAHIHAHCRPSVRQIIDSATLSTEAGWADWRPDWQTGRLPPGVLERLPGVFAWVAKDIAGTSTYVDTHCWVFTPASFLALAEAMTAIRRFPFVVEGFFPTEPGAIEFLVRLRSVGEDDSAAIHASIDSARQNLPAWHPDRNAPPP
jgi:SAM-dependent methyltransferase